MNSVYFKIKSALHEDKERILDIFFKDWVDTSCEDEVDYQVEVLAGDIYSPLHNVSYRRYKVNFQKQEDATALLLRGIPTEFQDYLEIVSYND